MGAKISCKIVPINHKLKQQILFNFYYKKGKFFIFEKIKKIICSIYLLYY